MPPLVHHRCLSLLSFLSLGLVTISRLFSSVSARPAELKNNYSARQTASSPRTDLSSNCVPFYTRFTDESTVSNVDDSNPNASPFVATSPRDTYAITPNGLELYLRRPEGEIRSDENGVNSQLSEGATINSTFDAQYGTATFEFCVTYFGGVIGAVIMIDATPDYPEGDVCRDEIDVELVGSGKNRWQTNAFAPSKADEDPHYGRFSQTMEFDNNPSITSLHNYTIEWDSEQITWYVDGQMSAGKSRRTLSKEDTVIDGVYHYPRHPLRAQIGIWDGSGAKGTSSWSDGPIDWDSAPQNIVATLRSFELKC